MNAKRTNETLKISDLISVALLSSLSSDLHQNINQHYSKKKVEEGDPVRSAERVPYSSSHQLAFAQPVNDADGILGGTAAKANVAAA